MDTLLEIQSTGGYDAFIASDKFGKLLEQRRGDVSKGKQSLIGTNVYAELTDTNFTDWDGIQFEGRLAEPFEKLAALQKIVRRELHC